MVVEHCLLRSTTHFRFVTGTGFRATRCIRPLHTRRFHLPPLRRTTAHAAACATTPWCPPLRRSVVYAHHTTPLHAPRLGTTLRCAPHCAPPGPGGALHPTTTCLPHHANCVRCTPAATRGKIRTGLPATHHGSTPYAPASVSDIGPSFTATQLRSYGSWRAPAPSASGHWFTRKTYKQHTRFYVSTVRCG